MVESSYIDLAFKGPLDWQHMLDFYRLRAINGLEHVSDERYQRQFEIEGANGWFSIRYLKTGIMRVEFELSDTRRLKALVNQLRRVFDLDTDILTIEQTLNAINPSLILRSGIRIPESGTLGKAVFVPFWANKCRSRPP